MKTLTNSALLLCGLIFATGCEKASVAPELAAPSSQNEAKMAAATTSKDRGIETRVTGQYNGQNFIATLRVSSFAFGSYGLVANGSLQQIGGGLSRTDAAALESTSVTFNINQVVNEGAYRSFYYNNLNDATAVYPFDVATESFTLSLSPYSGPSITLGAVDATGTFVPSYTSLVLSAAVTPRFNRVSSMVAALPTVYDRHNATFVNGANGELLAAGYAELGARLDAIADVVGRY
ncbi:hypothetical protein [Hymenobacter convexus]|uniref:hypothetical protein n=1 Tax=Hymenobacter sp. CA1UV-4 TaxID=3063782 RepID=UPI0027141CC5|nr:hypothetical protein [Hymenobacter sp. CA1UV-4]MDO7853270.1 hypothetical protein [Hymenobacter sp. CA1UV-4]